MTSEYDPTDEILVTVGASEGIDLALRALVEPGDEVLVPDPSYVSYMPSVRFAGGVCVAVPTDGGGRLPPHSRSACARAITPKTKALILPYPNNPTGAVMTPGGSGGDRRGAAGHGHHASSRTKFMPN